MHCGFYLYWNYSMHCHYRSWYHRLSTFTDLTVHFAKSCLVTLMQRTKAGLWPCDLHTVSALAVVADADEYF